MLILSDTLFASDPVHNNKASLGARAYEAFGAMLRVNPSIDLGFPAFDVAQRDHENLNQILRVNSSIDDMSAFYACAASQRDLKHRNQMHIEIRLNQVGRGRLSRSSQPAPREEWVNASQELNAPNGDDLFEAICISRVYSLLRLHPSICMLQLNDTTNTGLSINPCLSLFCYGYLLRFKFKVACESRKELCLSRRSLPTQSRKN
jgi:hypothetical protein